MSTPTSPKSLPAVGSRWLRTSVGVRGQGLHVVVTAVEPATVGGKSFHMVRYRYETTHRTSSSPADQFVLPSAHVLVPPAEDQTPREERLRALLETIERSAQEARKLFAEMGIAPAHGARPAQLRLTE